MRYILTWLTVMCFISAYGQESIRVEITDRQTRRPVAEVTIVDNDTLLLTTSDTLGRGTISLPDGRHKISFRITGYQELDTLILLPGISSIRIALLAAPEALEEVIVVASTRSNQGIENSPMKVEVLGATELSEEAGIKPGNIASILGDVSGVQIQQSSATSGNSNVRIQGLDGRYTQIIRDGMPLYDGFSGGFGILTVPPLDLKQIELIKGAASTLYGGGAIGGLVNLVSKKPTFNQSLDALINITSLKEVNANVYAAKRANKFGYTLFTGYTAQQAVDVNSDGLSDVPDISSVLIHPRLYYYPDAHTTLSLGYSGSFDYRKGGDMQVLNNNADSVHRYYEQNTSARHTGELLLEHTFSKEVKLSVKGNVSSFDRLINTNTYDFEARQTSYFSEASVFAPLGKGDLVAGVNIVGDQYGVLKPDTALLKNYDNFTTGAFAQYNLHIHEHAIAEAGLRVDDHKVYGTFVLPRIALFYRFNEQWAGRAGFGMGYKVPNPLVQQNIDYNPLYLLPLSSAVQPETSYGYNAEINYKYKWDKDRSLFINQAFFLTQVQRPILFLQAASGDINMVNASAPLVTRGSDTYVRLLLNSWELYLGYTFTDARNTYLPGKPFVALTPKNRGAFVLVREIEKKWRFGLEGSYTGSQYRYDATLTPGYVFIAVMLQRNLGDHVSVVLNVENLLDYRMSREESVYLGAVSEPIFKPLWAPIDGRGVNFSVRWKL